MAKLKIIIGLLVIGFAINPANLHARDWYVNNVGGNKQNRGTSADSPLQSITHALRKADQGDRIILQNTGVPYRESISLSGRKHCGTSLTPFFIIGNGATLDGRKSVEADQWQHVEGNIFRFEPRRKGHQMVYIGARPAKRSAVNKKADLKKLEEEHWTMINGLIYFRTKRTAAPENYDLSYCELSVGITLYRVKNVVIQDLVVQGYQLDGINSHDITENVLITGINSRGNGRSGISVGGASRCKIEGSVVGDNGAAQVRTEGYCQLEIKESTLLESDDYGPPLLIKGGKVTVDGKEMKK